MIESGKIMISRDKIVIYFLTFKKKRYTEDIRAEKIPLLITNKIVTKEPQTNTHIHILETRQ